MTREPRIPRYAMLDDADAERHPVDVAIEARLPQTNEKSQLRKLTELMLDALGDERPLYLAFEELRNLVAAEREAAYFDLGVEHGVAAARSEQLGDDDGASALTRNLVAQLLHAPLPPRTKLRALLMCAWAIVGSLPTSNDQENA